MEFTPDQAEAVAKELGFQNAALMVAFFKGKLLNEGLYEELRARAEQTS